MRLFGLFLLALLGVTNSDRGYEVEKSLIVDFAGEFVAEPEFKDADEMEEDDEGVSSDVSSSIARKMLITKRHFNYAMSKARRSVSEKDLALYEEFAEKQKAGRGEAATNFKFADSSNTVDDVDANDDLYD